MAQEHTLNIKFANPMLFDRLHTLAQDYAIPIETLIELAVERLIENVDFIRKLRASKPE
jgi:hypothetical protein